VHRPVGAKRPRAVGRAVNVARMRKFLVAVLATAAITAQAAITDGVITPDEWGKIALAGVGAALVYVVRNQPTPTTARSYPPPLRPTEPTRHVRREDRGP